MYIESNPGELGFPHHRMGPGGEGGWRHHMQSGGPGAEMQVQQQNPYLAPAPGMPGATAPYPMPGVPGMRHHHRRHHGMRGADGVEIMGFGADAPGAPVVTPPMVMAPVSRHSDTAMYVATGALILGLGFVIWKATR
jgi:hypothetical protein